VGRIRIANTTPAARLKTVTERNSIGSGIALCSDAALPAGQLPMLIERNQIPHHEPACAGPS
jgi:hypothetical protein